MRKIILFALLFLGCQSEDDIRILPTVKPPEIKYDLFYVPMQIYRTIATQSILNISEEKDDHITREYKTWLKKIYNTMDEERRIQLNSIHSNLSLQYFHILSITSELSDNANIEEVIQVLKHLKHPFPVSNEHLVDFYTYFYHTFFGREYQSIQNQLEEISQVLNDSLKTLNFCIYDFMEKYSGMLFNKRKNVEFHYTATTITAQRLGDENTDISTIKLDVRNLVDLFSTPFHEFSHILFDQMENTDEFKLICDSLKDVKMGYVLDSFVLDEEIRKNLNNIEISRNISLYENWDSLGVYSWKGTCEEDLVEGFAKYLEYKFSGRTKFNQNYKFDLGFFYYLKNQDMGKDQPNEKDFFRKSAINFYRKVIYENKVSFK